jgi:molecular chaperone GrpE (heat shock protein)
MLSFRVKFMVLYCLTHFIVPIVAVAQPAQSEKGVVCIYYKRLNPSNPSEGYLMQIINKNTTSGKFILRTSPDVNKAVYVDIGREIKPNEREVIERNLAARIGDMFSAKGDKSLRTIAQYRDLLTLIEKNDRVFRDVDLTKNFDIKDTVYLFDFDVAAQNYSIFKNDGRPEALALYHFTQERWIGGKFYADYKERVSKHDFKEFLEPSILNAIFQVPKSTPQNAELNDAQKKLLRDADQKATWAMLLAVVSFIVGIFGIFVSASQGKDKGEQLTRLEGKVKVLENRLNKPFYQGMIDTEEENKFSTQQIQSIVNRLMALEKAIGTNATQSFSMPTSFKNDTATKLLQLIQEYRQKWSANDSLSSVYASLSLCLDNFAFRLSELEGGMLTKDFVIKYVMPHIDSLDAIFQPEPDAPINTPESVNAYIRELQKLLSITEIEVRTKISRFDNERHEKAGAILRTNLEPGTITKVLRRGLIHGETVRKAQVIRTE